jgi:hypothetical protein
MTKAKGKIQVVRREMFVEAMERAAKAEAEIERLHATISEHLQVAAEQIQKAQNEGFRLGVERSAKYLESRATFARKTACERDAEGDAAALIHYRRHAELLRHAADVRAYVEPSDAVVSAETPRRYEAASIEIHLDGKPLR